MMDEYLFRLEGHLKDIKGILAKLAEGGTVAKLDSKEDYLDEFNSLKDLLAGDEWPQAVDPDRIVDKSDMEDKKVRAATTVNYVIDVPVADKNVLDFGCGDGLITAEISKKKATVAVGYDISSLWGKTPPSGPIFTTDWNKVASSGPYDLVVVHDVIDHILEGQVETLAKIKSVCKPGADVFVRCHPWCSRTATHLYDVMNKAYLHLVFSEVELVRLGIGLGEPTFKVIHPHLTYRSWFKSAGFDVVVEDSSTAPIEPFFTKTPLVAKRIKSNWSNSHEHELASGRSFPTFQLQMQFVDYRLKA